MAEWRSVNRRKPSTMKNSTRDFVVASIIFLVIFEINKKAQATPVPPYTPQPIIPPSNQNSLSYQDDYNMYLDH